MEPEQGTLSLRDNLIYLRSESLKSLAVLVGLIGYISFTWFIYPPTGGPRPLGPLSASLLWVFGAALGYWFRRRAPFVAAAFLVGSIWLGIASATIGLRIHELLYLFCLPVIFSGVLLGRRPTFVVAICTCVFILLLGELYLGLVPQALNILLPIVVIGTLTAASWLSAANLYTALDWMWANYENARHHAQLASDHQAELQQTLKALDEATYRLERANYMLNLAYDRAEEARRLKQQFAQTISHELRTPLNLIVGFTDLMVQSPEYYGGSLPPAYLRDLNIVHRNACHLQTLVNDVLDLARIEAAQMSIVYEDTNPTLLAQEAVNTARSLVESRGLWLRTDIAPDLPVVRLDPTRIRQVLFNLINNAARFTPQGGVTVGVKQQETELLFFVADTGVGIRPEDIPSMFTEFHQLDGTTRRRHEGAGLGLPISRAFVELHGGRIWVESTYGTGSTFYFTLPIERAASIADAATHMPGTSTSVVSRKDDERVLLVVTRSPSEATMLGRYVRGCRTIVLQDLAQAGHMAGQILPQGVLIDTSLLCRDGTESGDGKLYAHALQELISAWQLPRTTFMACDLPGEDPLGQRLAVDGFLTKPISRQGLWDMLRQFGQVTDKLLIIDDDRDFMRLLSRMLDNPVQHYQVIQAYNGYEGLEMVAYHRPGLILLDLVLPDMDGLQVVERVRNDPASRATPIIIISAQDQLDTLHASANSLLITRSSGLTPGEIIRLVQSAMDATTLITPITTVT